MKSWGIFLAATLAANCAVAQDTSKLVGTIYVSAEKLTAGGTLAGCALQYQALAQDHRYRKGGLVMVAGSLNLNYVERGSDRAVGMLLKVGTKDVEFNRQTPVVAPEFAFASSKNGSTASSVIDAALSDTPGYKSFVIRLDKPVAALLADILDGGPIHIAFNRVKGGMDVSVPIDLHVEEVTPSGDTFIPKRSDKALVTFAECFDQLAELIKR